MLKVYVHGSFMYDNFGDYLLFAKIMNVLNKCGKEVQAYSANVNDFYKDFLSYSCMDGRAALKQADCAVFAGGGYFGEPNHHKIYWNMRMLLKHAYPALKLIKKGKPVCILGVGVGPLSCSISRRVVANKSELVAVRDEESREFLRQYGVKKQVHVLPDWIMSCDVDELVKEGNETVVMPSKGRILIHLASKNKGGESPIEIIIRDILALEKKYKKKFLIITDQADNKQIERAEILQEKLKGIDIEIYRYHDPYELCRVIQNAQAVLTDKLHVGIVATRLGVPAFSVAYHNKTKRFYKQINREEYCVAIEDVKEGLIKEWLINGENKISKITNVIEQAKKNEELLEQFIAEQIRGK